jgi:hypothetical protein
LPEFVLEHLAKGVARQAVDEVQETRALECGESLGGERE